MDLTQQQVILFLGAAFFAEVIDSVIGFGSMLMLVPVASLFLPVPNAIVLAGLFHLFGSLSRTLLSITSVNKKIFLRFGIPAIIASPLGALLLPRIDSSHLQYLLGILLIFYAIFSLIHTRIRFHTLPVLFSFTGGLSGFFAGLLGTTGVTQSAVLTSLGLKNHVYLATGAAIALGIDISRVVVYRATGLLTMSFGYSIALLSVALIGALMGKRVIRRIRKRTETRIIFASLLAAGLYFISFRL